MIPDVGKTHIEPRFTPNTIFADEEQKKPAEQKPEVVMNNKTPTLTVDCPTLAPVLAPPSPPSAKITETKRTAVIIFAYDRPDYLKKTLDTVFSYIPKDIPVIVSQDATNTEVAEMARKYPRVVHIQNIFRKKPQKNSPMDKDGYYYLSEHYKFGLQTAFERLLFDNVIILEDDLQIAPDFFSYFVRLAPLLDEDPSIFCVSAWNDNGRKEYIKDPEALYRSDFFPGLGWMLNRNVWAELSDRWPKAFWDDWLRDRDRRKGRVCIRPEISRTFTFGSEGTSLGQFYNQYLRYIVLNDQPIDWSTKDVSYLKKEEYDRRLKEQIETAKSISNEGEITGDERTYKITYNMRDFTGLAQRLGIMDDEKDGVRRTAYKGIIHLRHKGSLLLLVPRDHRE
ncbi:alpha-1,3-mannosyl-glycoprotein 2-beta-N-acetylglucosaminyltransferase-like isoform 1 [Planoprotostelium fungivorum]|uniref:alpha-1,3-mannosyl-glycoprotein 2-beta-N-acetylglucosaminyltransferase n=1 Tax=Planoprotostelium fungivorum TaxID=1890364 RepID=A0A2P6MVD1_9EUKA|nr:alpha-1,3-mannosyl-glycoprotein 2-beta-N-acetylglucosaminyltransferase-like isoform 1 [Planoprotostelium fungivorum]